jgi:hypothetical protein
MQKVFIEGGFIRKLWDGETDAYRDHGSTRKAFAIGSLAASPMK